MTFWNGGAMFWADAIGMPRTSRVAGMLFRTGGPAMNCRGGA